MITAKLEIDAITLELIRKMSMNSRCRRPVQPAQEMRLIIPREAGRKRWRNYVERLPFTPFVEVQR